MHRDWQVEWTVLASDSGVTLRTYGHGQIIVVFPGMEGSGESCLHLAVPVAQQLHLAGRPARLLLVDYAQEAHASLDGLLRTIHTLLRSAVGNESATFWAQSYGNILATGVAHLGGLRIPRFVLVSAFTALPPAKTLAGIIAPLITPRFVYRATIKPVGRYIFGPVGDDGNHPFFDALQTISPLTAARRTSWLRARTFEAYFTGVRGAAKVWLGARDRLLDLDKQRAFFAGLADRTSNYSLALVQGAGHVALPSDVVRNLRLDLLAWLRDGA